VRGEKDVADVPGYNRESLAEVDTWLLPLATYWSNLRLLSTIASRTLTSFPHAFTALSTCHTSKMAPVDEVSITSTYRLSFVP